MVSPFTWLARQDPTPLLALLHHALAVAVALLAGALVFACCAWRPRQVEVAQLLHNLAVRSTFLTREERLARRLDRLLIARLRLRLARAGLARVSLLLFVLAALASGGAGAGLAAALLGVPPFVALGGGSGLALPWLWLGWRGQARQRLLNQQVVDMLWLVVSAIVNGESMPGALLEALDQGVRPPLRGPLRRALDDLVPARGVARPLLEVVARLEAELASPAFTLAERTIAAHQRGSTLSLASSLERVAGLAQEEITDQAEIRGDFALTSATAGFMFLILPLVVTLALHWVLPGPVEAAYSGPWGWAVALGIVGWCVIGYRMTTAGERSALAQAAL